MLRRSDEEQGYTLLEIMVVSLVLAVILAIGGGTFVSLNQTTVRNEAIVEVEQSASTVMAQLERDVRSANSLTIPSGSQPSNGLQLTVLEPDGTTTNVEWLYNSGSETLTREMGNGSSYQPSGVQVSAVSSAAFTYFNAKGGDITSHTDSDIATCTTAVGIYLQVAPNTSAVSPFDESAEVALTNQLSILTAPGNGQCGSTSS